MNDNTPSLREAVKEVADIFKAGKSIARNLTPEAWASINRAAHQRGHDKAGALLNALECLRADKSDPAAARSFVADALAAFGRPTAKAKKAALPALWALAREVAADPCGHPGSGDCSHTRAHDIIAAARGGR